MIKFDTLYKDLELSEKIIHRNGEYIVTSEDGKKVLGKHDSKEEALKQLRAIEWSKHHLNEDSTHAGYKDILATPRALGELDYKFFKLNDSRSVGDEVQTKTGPLRGSKIIEISKEILKYVHKDGSGIHIESVDLHRNIWESIHIPKKNLKYIIDF